MYFIMCVSHLLAALHLGKLLKVTFSVECTMYTVHSILYTELNKVQYTVPAPSQCPPSHWSQWSGPAPAAASGTWPGDRQCTNQNIPIKTYKNNITNQTKNNTKLS